MIGCAYSQRIFFSTRNPGVFGGQNGMHLTQGDCVEELHYFAEPLKLSCLKSFSLPSVYIGLVHHFATDTVHSRPVTMEAGVLSMAIGMSD